MAKQSKLLAAPPPRPWQRPSTVQRASASMTFAPHAAVQRPSAPQQAVAEELLPAPGGQFQVRSAQRHTLSPPSGTFNFVKLHGETPRSRPVLISARLAHAQLASGRPVVYAGTTRFERGEMAWWSNYSGTYQPIAAFRTQAGLPEDKFVPWQKLQMGGVAMQRGTFTERRAVAPQPAPGRATAPQPAPGRAVAPQPATGGAATPQPVPGAKMPNTGAAAPGPAAAESRNTAASAGTSRAGTAGRAGASKP